MPWHSTGPVGTISVKANRTILQDNTTYTEMTMGNSIVGTNTTTTRDHFWDVGTNEDGRHRFIQSPPFTVGGMPDVPVIGDGMGAVIWLKTTNGRPEWFHRNTLETYQITPNIINGSHNVTSSYTNIAAVPDGVFGEIFMWQPSVGKNKAQTGFFKSNGTAEAWSLYLAPQGSSESINLKFGNGSDASGLNIRVRAEDGAVGAWLYYITYRAF